MSKLEFEKILLSNDIFEREKHFLIEEYSDLESLFYSLPTDKILKFSEHVAGYDPAPPVW